MSTVHGLRLLPGGEELAAPTDETLLQTVLKAGLNWPSSCRNGTCRVCIGQLVRGTVLYRVEWPGLLPEEKAGGAVLPCVACPTSDVVLGPSAD